MKGVAYHNEADYRRYTGTSQPIHRMKPIYMEDWNDNIEPGGCFHEIRGSVLAYNQDARRANMLLAILENHGIKTARNAIELPSEIWNAIFEYVVAVPLAFKFIMPLYFWAGGVDCATRFCLSGCVINAGRLFRTACSDRQGRKGLENFRRALLFSGQYGETIKALRILLGDARVWHRDVLMQFRKERANSHLFSARYWQMVDKLASKNYAEHVWGNMLDVRFSKSYYARDGQSKYPLLYTIDIPELIEWSNDYKEDWSHRRCNTCNFRHFILVDDSETGKELVKKYGLELPDRPRLVVCPRCVGLDLATEQLRLYRRRARSRMSEGELRRHAGRR